MRSFAQKMKKAFLFALTAVILCISCGCHDKVELEDRGFVNTIGVDKVKEGKNHVNVSVILADIGSGNSKDSGDEEASSPKTAAADAFSAAMRAANTSTSKSMYYGLTKVCVLSGGVLADEKLLREIADGLERNGEISKKLIILATEGSAEELLSKKTGDEKLFGGFITKFYQNSENFAASTIMLNLEELVRSLTDDGSAVIPKIENNEGGIAFTGAAVIKDNKLAGYLTGEEMQGLVWVRQSARGAQVMCESDGVHIPFRVSKSKTKLRFSDDGGKLTCTAEISAEGTIEEYILPNGNEPLDAVKISELEVLLADEISRQITAAFEALYLKFKVDGFGIGESARKHYNGLYKKYVNYRSQGYSEINFKPRVTVRVTNAGSFK